MAAPSLNWLQLKGNALEAATQLQAECPKIKFTSGRRDLSDQARAMAGNVAKQPKWIVQTYKPSAASKACQAWVDANPKKPRGEIEAGLAKVLNDLSDSDAQKISRHLGGLAFDIQPNSADLTVVKKIVKEHHGEFLDHEGKLCRWHAQFSK